MGHTLHLSKQGLLQEPLFLLLLFQHQGAEVGVLAGIETGTVFLYPGEVAMTEDLGIGIVVQQTAEQRF